MCYSGCPNENFHGECCGKPNVNSHCFEGFVCEECGTLFEEMYEMSEINNVCLECYELDD